MSIKGAARPGVDESAPAARPAGRGLDRLLAAIDAGPRPFRLTALASLALTSVLAIALASLVRPAGPLPGPQLDIIVAALAALCLAAALALASLILRGRPAPRWADRVMAPPERAIAWLAFAAWLPFLLIVVYYRAAATIAPAVDWIDFGYDDKRWETAAYLLGALAPMLLLCIAARVLRVGRTRPASWRAWAAGLFPRASAREKAEGAEDAQDAEEPELAEARGRGRAGRILLVAAGLATALALAWYFLGPPWYLSQTAAPISEQEDVFLTGFQAIANGHLPYIGVAGVQYGPGTQLASYLLMRHVTSFSLVGFRQAWALFQWAGASVLFAVFFLAFGYARGLAASLLSVLVYPALEQVAFQRGGSFDGSWAWPNPLRYVGTIALVLLMPAVVRRGASWRGRAAAAALGMLWGVTSYLAQENLIAGAVGAVIVGALLLFSGTSSWRAVRAALAGVLAGFSLVWIPVLAWYAAHGALGQFLSLYFLFPRAVAAGWSDTPWQGATHLPSALTTMFYVLPFLLAVLALLTVIRVRPIRIATQWSRDRVLLAAIGVATILLYQGALLRSDAAHLTGTLLAVPGLVIVTATVGPRLLGGRRRVTLAVAGVALAAASCALLPAGESTWSSVRSAAEVPYLDRHQLAADPRPDLPPTLAAARVGAGLAGAPRCCRGLGVSMASFIGVMNRIHSIVGNGTAYVADFPYGYPGLVYFAADLNPAPVLADKYMTPLTQPQLTAYMAYFKWSVLPLTMAVITGSLAAPEARMFLQRYPGARRVTLHLGGKPYYVLARQG